MSEITEGRNPVLEALKSGRPVNKVLLASNIERHGVVGQILHLAREQGIPVEYAARPALDRLSTTAAHQGVIAFASVKEYVDLEELLAISKQKNEPPLYVVLDGIEDPQNLGSIIRAAEATGVHGVVIRERRAVGLTGAVAKASAGALEYVPVARVNNIAQAIETLKKSNVWVVGIDPSGKTEYDRVDYRPPTAIVIGGEGQGISDLVKKRCDILASIPMRGKITSLNAAVAAALAMYAAFRQRSGSPGPQPRTERKQ